MTVITVDMDDTLIRTSQDYTRAAEEFGEFMEVEFGISPSQAKEKRREIDLETVETYGLLRERHPMIFEQALRSFIENPSDQHISTVRSIGRSIFKTEAEYSSRGFMDGAEEMLSCLRTISDEMHLVTVGDPKVQQPKIDALGLDNWFDEIFIPSYEQGKHDVFQEILSSSRYQSEQFIHVGNSASSDVKAAITAGGYAVYISDEVDWLSNEKIHTKFMNHNRVYPYKSATEFLSDAPVVLKSHCSIYELMPRII